MGERAPGWYITTERLTEGGEVVDGPFSTNADANRCRVWVEALRHPITYWIDEEPAVAAGETDQ